MAYLGERTTATLGRLHEGLHRGACGVFIVSAPSSAELSHSLQVSVRRRNTPKPGQNRARIVRNRCVPVCGYRAGDLGLGLAQLEAQIWLEMEDFRQDP